MSFQKKDPLFESITTVLSCCLHASAEAQEAAIERKKVLEVIDEYPVVLCDIISSEEAFPERQLASIFLRNYLKEAYKKSRVTNTGIALFQKDIGKKLCLNLLEILCTISEPIKSIVCTSLSILCVMGFWPHVNPLITNMLDSGNACIIDVAVSLLKETFVEPFEDALESQVEHAYINRLLEVLKMNTLSSETRANAISPMYSQIKALHDNEEVLMTYLPVIGADFETVLNEPYSDNSNFHLKCEIIQCLSDFIEEIPRVTNIGLPASLSAIGNLLTICCTNYKALIRENASVPRDASETDIEEPVNFYLLVMATMEFMKSLFRYFYFEILMDDLDNILYCILVFMSCHHDMDKQLFLENYDKGYYFALRTLCVQIIQEIFKNFNTKRPNGRSIVFKNLNNAFQKLSTEIQEGDTSPTLYMLRINESMMFALGECYSYFDKNGEYVFPLLQYMEYWTTLARSQSNLMITGRLLWLGGIFNSEMTPEMLNVHLKTIMENLNVEETYLHAVCAGALKDHLMNFQQMPAENQHVITNLADEILLNILSVAEESIPHSCILTVLGHFIQFNINVAIRHFPQIEELLIRVLCEHASSVNIMNELNFIVSSLAQLWTIRDPLQRKFLSLLVNVLHNKGPAALKEEKDKALQLLNTYILYSQDRDNLFLLEIFVGAKQTISENCNSTTEQASILMTTMLVKASEQLKYLADEKGDPILHNLPGIIQWLFQPANNVSGDIPVLLTVVSIYYFPEMMEPHFNTILKHVITTNSQNFKNVRCIWLVFLFICMLRPTDTLSFLSSLPGPNGGSALSHVLGLWGTNTYSSVTNIERQIQVLCITKIIEHCLANQLDFQRMCDISISFVCPTQPEKFTGVLNGLETLYQHLIYILHFQDYYQERLKEKAPDFDEHMKITDENNQQLFKGHPFNIDITTTILNFLKTATPPYFSVLQKVFGQNECDFLRQFGCAVPDNVQLHEQME